MIGIEGRLIKIFWVAIFCSALLWSAINPKDHFTWALEVAPAIVAALLMLVTYNRFRLTPLLYCLILIHCVVLMIGGHYTYAEVPLFDWLKEIMGSTRNNYDKVGHFFQGFVPALLAREILIRKNVVNGKAWLNTFIISICLAFSAFYELLEWWVALLSGENAASFLGTQGYIWDTQSDMFLALIGALFSIILLSVLHDKQLTDMIKRED